MKKKIFLDEHKIPPNDDWHLVTDVDALVWYMKEYMSEIGEVSILEGDEHAPVVQAIVEYNLANPKAVVPTVSFHN